MGVSVLSTYGGSGLNVARLEVKIDQAVAGPGSGSGEETTEYGLNLLVGALANLGKIKPYGEARFEIEGGKQLVLTAGAYINLGAGKSAIR